MEWFFDRNYKYMVNFEDEDSDIERFLRIEWKDLELYGWNSEYLENADLGDIPDEPGIYVVVHELEQPTLYVGKSFNLRKRVSQATHHKIKMIIQDWETSPMGYHEKHNVAGDILIFWKTIKEPFYNNSIEKSLLWYESITIGLLCPIMQGKVSDMRSQDWAKGMNFYT